MNLFEILKQFKNIEPDRAFSETSKRAIFAMNPQEPAASFWTAQRTFFRIVETGVAVALTGFFVLLLTGSFGGATFAPVQPWGVAFRVCCASRMASCVPNVVCSVFHK